MNYRVELIAESVDDPTGLHHRNAIRILAAMILNQMRRESRTEEISLETASVQPLSVL